MFKWMLLLGSLLFIILILIQCDEEDEDNLEKPEIDLFVKDVELHPITHSKALLLKNRVVVFGTSDIDEKYYEGKIANGNICQVKDKKPDEKEKIVKDDLCQVDATLMQMMFCNDDSDDCVSPELEKNYDLSDDKRPDITVQLTHCLKGKTPNVWMGLSQSKKAGDNNQPKVASLIEAKEDFKKDLGKVIKNMAKAASEIKGHIAFNIIGKEAGESIALTGEDIHLTNITPYLTPDDKESISLSVGIDKELSEMDCPKPETSEESAATKTSSSEKAPIAQPAPKKEKVNTKLPTKNSNPVNIPEGCEYHQKDLLTQDLKDQTEFNAHFISVYQAHGNHGPGRHPEGSIQVSIEDLAKPALIVLTSYEPVAWSVDITDENDVLGVLILGYHAQRMTTVADIPLEIHDKTCKSRLGSISFPTKYPSNGANRLVEIVSEKVLPLKEVLSYQAKYEEKEFVIGEVK